MLKLKLSVKLYKAYLRYDDEQLLIFCHILRLLFKEKEKQSRQIYPSLCLKESLLMLPRSIEG